MGCLQIIFLIFGVVGLAMYVVGYVCSLSYRFAFDLDQYLDFDIVTVLLIILTPSITFLHKFNILKDINGLSSIDINY